MQLRSLAFSMRTGCALACVLACTFAGYAQSPVQPKPAPLTAEQNAILGKIVGAWQNARSGFGPPPPGAPAPAPLPDGLTIENPYSELEKVSTAHLQPWALAKQQATEWDVDDTGAVCKRDGIFRQGLATGFGMNFVRGHDKLEWIGDVEEIGPREFLLNTPHPADLLPTWNGDSRAHFEGKTLVVDTIGFNDKSWLGSDRQPHTEELHVIEFLSLHGDDQYLEDRVIVDDRKALTSPYTFSRVYKRQPLTGEAGNGPAGPGVSNAHEDICNQSKIGHDPWRRKRETILEEHKQELDAFIQQVTAKK